MTRGKSRGGRQKERKGHGNIHIDWSEGAVSDGTSQGTGKREAGVEVNTLRGLRHSSGNGSHCDDGCLKGECARCGNTRKPGEFRGKGGWLKVVM